MANAGQNRLDVYYPQLDGAGGKLDPDKLVDAINRIYDFYYRAVPTDPNATTSTIITDGFIDQILQKLHLVQLFLSHETFFASTAICSWNTHQLNYKAKEYSIPAGSTTDQYIYWTLTAPSTYKTSTTFPTLGADDYVVAQYDAATGTVKEVWQPRNTLNLLAQVVTGTGTNAHIPKFTNGATGVIGDSSISDNGTTTTLGDAFVALLGAINAYGGASPTDGLLLIGNGNTQQYDAHVITPGTGIGVTNGHGTITIASTISYPLAVASGGTAANSAAGARSNLGAAAAGAPGAHSITLAAITGGGTPGSITWNADGVVTAFTDPT